MHGPASHLLLASSVSASPLCKSISVSLRNSVASSYATPSSVLLFDVLSFCASPQTLPQCLSVGHGNVQLPVVSAAQALALHHWSISAATTSPTVCTTVVQRAFVRIASGTTAGGGSAMSAHRPSCCSNSSFARRSQHGFSLRFSEMRSSNPSLAALLNSLFPQLSKVSRAANS